jgi:dTDP-4-amino-4,6-dideoxygalactose transaminase
MGFRTLPPVRSRVALSRCSSDEGIALFDRLFPRSTVELLGSGTQSLGLAISRAAVRGESKIKRVIVPAYGCPDLISACIQAGVEPKLVDVASSGWGYDPEALHRAASDGCIAVVLVNFLGVGDDRKLTLRSLGGLDIPVVHDSAQSMPTVPEQWAGDVVLSFGRGKPINLLHGGALISAGQQQSDASLYPRSVMLDSLGMAIAFNLLTHPLVYHWARHVPRFQVGETRYKPPSELGRLPESAFSRIGAALKDYLNRKWENPWLPVIGGWASKGIFPLCASATRQDVRLLRMPLLAQSRVHRDKLVALLNSRGLGASPMYKASLPRVSGVPQSVVAQGPFRNADRLADRLFTLPTHASVKGHDVAEADRCVRRLG